MPAPIVKNIVDQTDATKAEVEKHWKNLKTQYQDKGLEGDNLYQAIIGTLKKMYKGKGYKPQKENIKIYNPHFFENICDDKSKKTGNKYKKTDGNCELVGCKFGYILDKKKNRCIPMAKEFFNMKIKDYKPLFFKEVKYKNVPGERNVYYGNFLNLSDFIEEWDLFDSMNVPKLITYENGIIFLQIEQPRRGYTYKIYIDGNPNNYNYLKNKVDQFKMQGVASL